MRLAPASHLALHERLNERGSLGIDCRLALGLALLPHHLGAHGVLAVGATLRLLAGLHLIAAHAERHVVLRWFGLHEADRPSRRHPRTGLHGHAGRRTAVMVGVLEAVHDICYFLVVNAILAIGMLVAAALPALDLLRQAFRSSAPAINVQPSRVTWLLWSALQAAIVVGVFMFNAHLDKPVGGYGPIGFGLILAFYATYAVSFYVRLLSGAVVVVHREFERLGQRRATKRRHQRRVLRYGTIDLPAGRPHQGVHKGIAGVTSRRE